MTFSRHQRGRNHETITPATSKKLTIGKAFVVLSQQSPQHISLPSTHFWGPPLLDSARFPYNPCVSAPPAECLPLGGGYRGDCALSTHSLRSGSQRPKSSLLAPLFSCRETGRSTSTSLSAGISSCRLYLAYLVHSLASIVNAIKLQIA
jgi:hypothetical protein